MNKRQVILRAAALACFAGFAAWAIWSETAHGVAAAPLEGGEADPTWRRAALWDDGKAEFCAYEARWPRYGATYDGRVLQVLVKEPWATDLEVKADRPRDDGFEVLKLNQIRDVPTGIYTYHQMASVFFRRQSGELQKLAAMSSEACGLSTAQMVDGSLNTRSYFDGQGEQSQPYPAGALPEDGLPALLRDFVVGTPPEALEVFPSLMAGRFPELAPTVYRVRKRELAAVTVPAGTFRAVEIELAGPGPRLSFAFESEAPHRLIRLERGDGTEYRMVKCERISYWNMNRPGGEQWLPESVR